MAGSPWLIVFTLDQRATSVVVLIRRADDSSPGPSPKSKETVLETPDRD